MALTLRRSARARRISLRVSSLDGRVTLTMPKSITETEALDFAREKENWIRRHLDKQTAPVSVTIGETILFRGVETEISIGSVRRAEFRDGAIIVPDRPDMVAARIKAFLKIQAKETLDRAVERYAGMVNREVSQIRIRDTRSRWGSCTTDGHLMFSWRLIMTPPEVLDYVAAHEVAHLIEMNHSPAYWRVVAKIYPDYQKQRGWLRRNGALLHRYRFGD